MKGIDIFPIVTHTTTRYFSHTRCRVSMPVDGMGGGYAILVCCRNESKKHEWKRNQWLKPKREMETGRAERRVCALSSPDLGYRSGG